MTLNNKTLVVLWYRTMASREFVFIVFMSLILGYPVQYSWMPCNLMVFFVVFVKGPKQWLRIMTHTRSSRLVFSRHKRSSRINFCLDSSREVAKCSVAPQEFSSGFGRWNFCTYRRIMYRKAWELLFMGLCTGFVSYHHHETIVIIAFLVNGRIEKWCTQKIGN